MYGLDARAMLRSEYCDCDLLYGLAQRLSLEPNSQFRAEQLGSPEWYGYSRDLAVLTDIADYTIWSGQTSAVNKVKFKQQYSRPEVKKTPTVITPNELPRMPGVTVTRQR